MVLIIGIAGLAHRRRRRLCPAARPADRRRPGGPGGGERLPHQQQLDPGDRSAPGRSRPPTASRDGSAATAVDVDIDTDNGVAVKVDDPVAAPELVPRRARHAELGRDDHGARRSPASPTRAAGAGAVHLLDRRVQRRRHAEVPDRRPTSARRTATSRRASMDIAWTNYGTGNVNTQRGLATSSRAPRSIDKTLDYGEYIGQQNNGNHTTLYGDVDTYLRGQGDAGRDRRRQRQLHGLGDVPRQQRRPAARTSTSTATS